MTSTWWPRRSIAADDCRIDSIGPPRAGLTVWVERRIFIRRAHQLAALRILTKHYDAPQARPVKTILAKTFPERVDEAFRSEEHTSELQSQSNLVCRLP